MSMTLAPCCGRTWTFFKLRLARLKLLHTSSPSMKSTEGQLCASSVETSSFVFRLLNSGSGATVSRKSAKSLGRREGGREVGREGGGGRGREGGGGGREGGR